MKTIKVNVGANYSYDMCLGRQYENAVRMVEFDVKTLRETYGEGILTAVAIRDGDTNPYPVVLTDNTWVISSADTAKQGHGQLQVTWLVDEAVKKSVIYKTEVLPSLNAETVEPPEPYQTYLDAIIQVGQDTEAAAVSAHESVEELERVLESISVVDVDNGNIVISLG